MLEFTNEEILMYSTEEMADRCGLTRSGFALAYRRVHDISYAQRRKQLRYKKVKELFLKHNWNIPLISNTVSISESRAKKIIYDFIRLGKIDPQLMQKREYNTKGKVRPHIKESPDLSRKTEDEINEYYKGLIEGRKKIQEKINKMYDKGIYHGAELNKLCNIDQRLTDKLWQRIRRVENLKGDIT